ncbi:MAG TPA: hypothetical protein VF741_05015 [Candidatus Aquilonibacter sp.]
MPHLAIPASIRGERNTVHQDGGAGMFFGRIRVFTGATARAIRDRIEHELTRKWFRDGA